MYEGEAVVLGFYALAGVGIMGTVVFCGLLSAYDRFFGRGYW